MEENGDADTLDLVPINPIEEKDNQIAALEKRVDILKTKETEIIQVKEALSTSELKTAKSDHRTSLKKLNFNKGSLQK